MSQYVRVGSLQVSSILYQFINRDVLPTTNLLSSDFLCGVEEIVSQLSPINQSLLRERVELQDKINRWHKVNKGFHVDEYEAFLKEIGYLEEQVDDFSISTENVDEEIALQAGPQLVVPVDNARYALNAANARWGSLYDALYGTDVISEEEGAEKTTEYNPIRGQKVIQYAKRFLDSAIPLVVGSHVNVTQYSIVNGELHLQLMEGKVTTLKEPYKVRGYTGDPLNPSSLLFKNNDLHFEILIDSSHPIGLNDLASVKDIIMESALTTIMDCEDSVSAVDAADKVRVYRNWLGLMKGDLTASFSKGGREINRKLNDDKTYTTPEGETLRLKGRSLMLVRNVGHLMTTDAILDEHDNEVYEGIVDAIFTSLIAMHSLNENATYQNSEKGSIYIVKPKMHGSKEVDFANTLFNSVEDLLGLDRNTIKIGVMDEERRTSLNLKACISKVRERIVFINTGFLDRTGDEIHTSMEAGAMIPKEEMKGSVWLNSYEKSNVYEGLRAGFKGKAQIGKGMWAIPDKMAEMMKQKVNHPLAGANTAWVPSPTAATLHALHYHEVNVREVQGKLNNGKAEYRGELLQVPVAKETNWNASEIMRELDNNAQGILGYVVRWVGQGIGCSKVPNIDNVGLMEDRATLRISSQCIANWLHHEVCTKEQVTETLQRMAVVVDRQNAGDPNYEAMTTNLENSLPFQAACELIFEGATQPNGYTEPILHRYRRLVKKKIGTVPGAEIKRN